MLPAPEPPSGRWLDDLNMGVAVLDDAQVESIASELAAAHRLRQPYRRLAAGRAGAGVDDAYRVQARLQRLLQADQAAGPIAGWKIALTSAAMQALVHVDEPLAGCVFASRVHPDRAVIELSRHQHLGVEFEVAVWLREALGPRPGGHDIASVTPAVGACAAALELVEDRNADYGDIDAFSLAADNCWNAGVVVGAQNRDWQAVDLARTATRLWLDGEPAGEGIAGDALGHPLLAVAWLADLLGRQGRSLPAGALIMTGSSITTRFPLAGQVLTFEVDGLGTVEASFRA